MVARAMSHPMAAPSEQLPSPRAGHCEFLEVEELELDTSSLNARLIRPDAKQSLLPLQFPSVGSFDDYATTLLADLDRLAPSVAKDFAPKTSCLDNNAFRLLNDAYFEGEEESYIAMSYVWKKVSRDTPKKLVSPLGNLPFGWVTTVQQFPLPTTKGMFQAVLSERRDGEGLWFDQVCINQEDETEKAAAIGTMDIIYKNARVVVVALDDVSATAHEMQFLEHYNRHYVFSDLPLGQHPNRGLNPPIMQQHPLFRSFIERVLRSMWFERAWCALEMRMGRNHVFLVPCEAEHQNENTRTVIRFTGAFFVHMLVLAREIISPFLSQPQIRSLLRCFAKSYLQPQGALTAQTLSHLTPPLSESFVFTIADIFALKAGGNPILPENLRRLDANRDKTSIILNISGMPIALKPISPLQRPSIEDECLRQLLLVGLAARDPVTLCTTGAPLQLHDGSISWLCKPTALDLPASYLTPPPAFPKTATPITQGSDGRAEYIQLDLVFLDLPHRTHPNPNFPAHVRRASEFVDLCIHYQVQSHSLWNLWQAPNHPRAPAMRNTFIQTLACIFECGAAWLLDAVAQPFFPQGALGLDPMAVEMLFTPQPLMPDYANLTLFSAVLNTIATFIAHGIPWASAASEATHGPLIISTLSSPAAPIPSPVCGKALIFAPFAHSKTLLVAVPAAVKSPDYAGLARGWILTSNPFTGSPRGPVSWVLRGKGTIFGDSGFDGWVGGEWVQGEATARVHRVYGVGEGVV